MDHRRSTASTEEIYLHLKECDREYQPPLGERVDLREYAGKIAAQAVTFEAWEGRRLVGLVAAYLNDPANPSGYITDVSVNPESSGRGVAAGLLQDCIDYARSLQVKEIRLEVNRGNSRAVHLYTRFGFEPAGERADCLTMKLDLARSTPS